MFRFVRLDDFAHPPTRRGGDAGWDFYSSVMKGVLPGGVARVKTSLIVSFPKKNVLLLSTRSSMASKGIVVVGGVIDSSYRGEVEVLLLNTGKEPYYISIGDKIAQGLLLNLSSLEPIEATKVSQTERGVYGFGSTGK